VLFIMGINTGRKELYLSQEIQCPHCGQYGRYTVYMTYTVLSLFFIPVLKWNRRYYVTCSHCQTSWELDKETGKRIVKEMRQ